MNDIGLKLQNELRKVEGITTLYELSKKLGVGVDDILTYIQDIVLPSHIEIYKKNAFKIPFFTDEQTKEFFTRDIIDIGFLCQHKIKEINEQLGGKLNTFAYQIFYSNWLMNRGY